MTTRAAVPLWITRDLEARTFGGDEIVAVPRGTRVTTQGVQLWPPRRVVALGDGRNVWVDDADVTTGTHDATVVQNGYGWNAQLWVAAYASPAFQGDAS